VKNTLVMISFFWTIFNFHCCRSYRSKPNYVVTYFCRDLIMSFRRFCHYLNKTWLFLGNLYRVQTWLFSNGAERRNFYSSETLWNPEIGRNANLKVFHTNKKKSKKNATIWSSTWPATATKPTTTKCRTPTAPHSQRCKWWTNSLIGTILCRQRKSASIPPFPMSFKLSKTGVTLFKLLSIRRKTFLIAA